MILEKENERYKLIPLNFFSNIEQEVDFIENNFDVPFSSFTVWKTEILNKYYKFRDFKSFVQKNKSVPLFKSIIKNIFSVELATLSKYSSPTKADRYLSVQSNSISYSLSNTMFNDLYREYFLTHDLDTYSTEELYNYCKKIIGKLFPHSEKFIIEQLKNNDEFFWNKIYEKIKYLVNILSNTRFMNENNTKGDIWSESCRALNDAFMNQKIQPLNAGTIFGYATGIVKNKNREQVRTVSKNICNICDDIEKYIITENKSQNYINLQCTNNTDEEINFLAQILYNNYHPLHKEFIKGLEDKVDILFAHYLNKMTYEDIVMERNCRQTISKQDIEREAANLRKDVSRLKRILKERFYSLQNKYKK